MLCNAIEDTVKKTWDKLEEMFASKLLSNKLFLKEERHCLNMEKGTSMMEHMRAFNRCIANLQKMDEIYELEDKVVMMLTSLPLSYKHFHTKLMFGNETLMYEEVMKDILTHHRMVQHSGDSS